MASITVIISNCQYPDCEARATRRVLNKDGSVDADMCARHANLRLVELAKEEGLGLHEPKPVKAVRP